MQHAGMSMRSKTCSVEKRGCLAEVTEPAVTADRQPPLAVFVFDRAHSPMVQSGRGELIMSENILVCVAWPYANADIHCRQYRGARICPPTSLHAISACWRNQVLMVSGTDSHGTPVTIRADAEHTTPLGRCLSVFQQRLLDLLYNWGISFRSIHQARTPKTISRCRRICFWPAQGVAMYREKQQMPYALKRRNASCPSVCGGECYICHFPDARAISATPAVMCSTPYSWINPRSRIDGSRLSVRETEHTFSIMGNRSGNPAI